MGKREPALHIEEGHVAAVPQPGGGRRGSGLAAETAFREAAARPRRPLQNLSAAVCGTATKTERLLVEYGGVHMVPTLRIIEDPTGNLKRYRKDPYGKPLTSRDIEDFASEWEMGAVTPFRRSEIGVELDETHLWCV